MADTVFVLQYRRILKRRPVVDSEIPWSAPAVFTSLQKAQDYAAQLRLVGKAAVYQELPGDNSTILRRWESDSSTMTYMERSPFHMPTEVRILELRVDPVYED